MDLDLYPSGRTDIWGKGSGSTIFAAGLMVGVGGLDLQFPW